MYWDSEQIKIRGKNRIICRVDKEKARINKLNSKFKVNI